MAHRHLHAQAEKQNSPRNDVAVNAEDIKLHPEWKDLLAGEFGKPYFERLVTFVKNEYRTARVYPEGPNIFRALNTTPPGAVKAVILGQDPYHGPGQADGLCFSVQEGVKVPPSLRNIFKEIERDLGHGHPLSGNLEPWARRGVLLLNAVLTVRDAAPGSHRDKGWEVFTDRIIRVVNEHCDGVVFMLWGSYARKKAAFIDPAKHLVLESPHPSPLSAHRGFLGNGHFSRAEGYLKNSGKTPIDWRL